MAAAVTKMDSPDEHKAQEAFDNASEMLMNHGCSWRGLIHMALEPSEPRSCWKATAAALKSRFRPSGSHVHNPLGSQSPARDTFYKAAITVCVTAGAAAGLHMVNPGAPVVFDLIGAGGVYGALKTLKPSLNL